MITERFRYQLRQEARQWVTDGLLQPEQFDRLADRYQFRTLDQGARNRFVTILLCLGGVLLGLGVITFVAANWQQWPRAFRVGVLLSALLGVQALGFYLWRSPAPRLAGQRRLGQALLLLGGLLLGANLALTAQMFHQGGPLSSLYFIWGGGVLTMAIGLRLMPLGLLALILTIVGYWSGLYDWWEPEPSWQRALAEHMPLVSALAFLPLAHVTRSRFLFGLAWLFTLGTLQTNFWWSLMHPWVASVLSLALPFALGWGYRDRLWPAVQRWWLRLPLPRTLHHWLVPGGAIDPRPLNFQNITQNLTILWLMGMFYFTSFWFFWEGSGRQSGSSTDGNIYDPAQFVPWLAVDVAVAAVAAVLMWARRGRGAAMGADQWLTDAVLWALVLSLGLTLGWHYNVAALPNLGTLLANVCLFLLGVGLVREGLSDGRRLAFWSGLLLLVLDIWTRMLEYNTDLLLKALVFVLCGVGVIAAGLWFERSVQTLNGSNSSPTARS